MVPRKGQEPSSGIQTLELVVRGFYIVFGLALVSSLLSAVVAAAEVLNRWNGFKRTKGVYKDSLKIFTAKFMWRPFYYDSFFLSSSLNQVFAVTEGRVQISQRNWVQYLMACTQSLATWIILCFHQSFLSDDLLHISQHR